MSSTAGSGGVLKQINKYLIQAKKIDAIDPVIGYYCRFYAAQKAMKLRKTKEDLSVVNELISWCEKNKFIISSLNKEEARSKIEAFSLQIFAEADNQDRSENGANQSTAAAFYTAFILMDVCRQFGELASDIEQKIKYSGWKAMEINRAIKEGRKPTPGGADENNEENENFSNNNNNFSNNNNSNINNEFNGQSPSTTFPSSSFSSLPSSYPPASLPQSFDDAAPPLPPLPSAYNPAAYGSPDVDNPIDHRFPNLNDFPSTPQQPAQAPPTMPMKPAAQSSQPQPRSSAPPSSSSSQSSPQSARFQSSPSPSFPTVSRTRADAAREAERQIKHALSALNFDDFDTTYTKLSQALQTLEQHRTK